MMMEISRDGMGAKSDIGFMDEIFDLSGLIFAKGVLVILDAGHFDNRCYGIAQCLRNRDDPSPEGRRGHCGDNETRLFLRHTIGATLGAVRRHRSFRGSLGGMCQAGPSIA